MKKADKSEVKNVYPGPSIAEPYHLRRYRVCLANALLEMAGGKKVSDVFEKYHIEVLKDDEGVKVGMELPPEMASDEWVENYINNYR